MTPSARQHMTEQLVRIRRAEQRDLVDNAVYAMIALSDDQKRAAVELFNAILGLHTRSKDCVRLAIHFGAQVAQ